MLPSRRVPVKENSWRAEVLLSHLAPPVREHTADVDGVEDVLERLLEAGERGHPHIDLAPERFLRFLADILHAREGEPIVDVLDSLPVADVYLAAACASGDAAAISVFCAEMFPPTRASLAKIGANDTTIDETLQRLRIMHPTHRIHRTRADRRGHAYHALALGVARNLLGAHCRAGHRCCGHQRRHPRIVGGQRCRLGARGRGVHVHHIPGSNRGE